MLGSLGAGPQRTVRDHESFDSRTDIQETGAISERESVATTIF